MKRIVYTLLAMTMISMPTSFALAQISLDANSSTSGTVGVGVPGVNVGVGVNADVDAKSNNQISPNNASPATTRPQSSNGDMKAGAKASTRAASSLDAATIRNIQTSLNQRGYHVGNVDGRWNTNTAAQLRRFEQNQGLPTSGGTNLSVNSLQQLGVGVNNINSAAGAARNVTPSTRVMGGVQGGASYND